MKRCFLIFIAVLIFANMAQSQAVNPTEQIKQLKNEVAEGKIIIADLKAERNGFILELATLNAKIIANNRGIDRATNLLQKGYDSGKLNYKEIWDCGFRISVDSSNVYQRPKSKDKKDK